VHRRARVELLQEHEHLVGVNSPELADVAHGFGMNAEKSRSVYVVRGTAAATPCTRSTHIRRGPEFQSILLQCRPVSRHFELRSAMKKRMNAAAETIEHVAGSVRGDGNGLVCPDRFPSSCNSF